MAQFGMEFPETFEDAVSALAATGGKPIAGGTALGTLMKEGVFQPECLVNLRDLADEHSYVTRDGDRLRIGALARLRAIETSDLVREHVPLLATTLAEVASIRVRNAATLGGNIAHADPDLDLPPVLAGLDASVVIHGQDGERTLPFTEFVQGYYQTDLGEAELVKAVTVPIPSSRDGVYYKHRSLSQADWPCVGVAAFQDQGATSVPSVYLTAVADTPVFAVDGLESVFADGITREAIDEAGAKAADQCDPIGDARGSASYKREMAREFTIRALRDVTGVGATELQTHVRA